MNELVGLLAPLVGAALGGGGLVAVVNAFARRRSVRADAAARLSDGALKWVEEFQEEAHLAQAEAKDARKEAAEARREAGEALAQMRIIRAEAEALAGQLKALRRAILDPNATLDRLRIMVGPDPNGAVH